jgi:hypothetical protein
MLFKNVVQQMLLLKESRKEAEKLYFQAERYLKKAPLKTLKKHVIYIKNQMALVLASKEVKEPLNFI